jgi:TorA maturation chaperone TorD
MTASALHPDEEGWAVIGDDLALLARLHDREIDADLIASLRAWPVADWFALTLTGEEFEQAARLLEEALSRAPDPMTREALDEMAAEYAAIYLNHTYRISACESFWMGEDGLERQDAMFAARRCYARLGFLAPNWRLRADDHIAYELAFLAKAARRLGDPEVAREIAQFMREHPLAWVPAFAGRVARRSLSPFYAGTALLTASYLMNLGQLLQRYYGIEMTPVERKQPSTPGLQGPTCADPPPRYAPGLGPGW